MEISDNLLCLFSATLEARDGSYIIEIPEQEVDLGTIHDGTTYRVAMLSDGTDGDAEYEEQQRKQDSPGPPVEEGETREVEIEDIGEKGDGITRVERGFVVIVPDTEKGERVTIEIAEVRENVAFAEVVERQTHVR